MSEQITSKQMLNSLMSKHYEDAFKAKEEGKPVIWATSIVPQEILEVFDVAVVYPENHAAAVGARKDAPQFIEVAEKHGYSVDICSYARLNIGYADILESSACNIPEPDLIICGDNICCAVIKWYENLAKKFDIPMIMIDYPSGAEYQSQPENIKYVYDQYLEAIRVMEQITGQKFDHDKFAEVTKISNENANWWKKATDLLAHTPAPTNGFDLFNYMAPMVTLRGKPEGTELFKLWYEELQYNIDNGIGPWKDQEEKYRIIWDGIACWPHLGATYEILKKYGVNVVTSTYPTSWHITYKIGDMMDMAREYSKLYVLRNFDSTIEIFYMLADNFNLDGILFHSNRSCKGMDFRQLEVARTMNEKYGLPSVFFDGDQTDPSVFSPAQYETRVQALVEMMEERKRRG